MVEQVDIVERLRNTKLLSQRLQMDLQREAANEIADLRNQLEARTPTPDGTASGEIDAEVERIMAMTDDEIMATASADDVAWARGFKIGLRSGQDPVAASTPKRDEEQAGETLKASVTAIMARCEALEDEAHECLGKANSQHATGFYRGQKDVAKSIRRELHDLTRTALAAAHKEQS